MSDSTNPDQLSTTIFVLTTAGAVAYAAVVFFFVLWS